ncbi:MAG: BadF/BadG/BcrA/BcrD ATPase family protein [Phyllobacterium sp.]
MRLLLGVDGGGTGCRAALATPGGHILGIGKSGSANMMTDIDIARRNIVEAARLAFIEAGLDPTDMAATSAFLGLAGANVSANREILSRTLPFQANRIETDAIIALYGAIEDHDGTVVILGTGSAFISQYGGTIRIAGGWGFKVSDLGGGARIGRDVLEETLLAHDGFHRSSPMTDAAMAQFAHDPRKIVEFAHSAKPGDFGRFAPLAFEYADSGDEVAGAIIARAVRQIEEGLNATMPKDDNLAGRLCLLGGLAPLYADRLSRQYRDRLQSPLGDALNGAVKLAVRNFYVGEAANHGQVGHG